MIVGSELVLRRSKWSAPSQNGGPMAADAVFSGERGNLFADIPQVERAAGSTVRRKVFWHLAHVGILPFVGALAWLAQVTPIGTRVRLIEGTQRDLESDLIGSERIYGVGTLADASAGMAITVDAESGAGADDIFQAGDTIRVWDGSNAEFAAVDAVTWTGDQAEITLTSALTHSYGAGALAASCIAAASIGPSYSDVSTTGTVGFDSAYLELDGLGSLEETVTLTFSSATAFSASSDYWGALGSGTISAPFAPANPPMGVQRWTIYPDAWIAGATAGDTVTFIVHPAAWPLWLERIAPAGLTGGDDGTALGLWGES